VNLAGKLQNTLGDGCFTGVYMGENADVPITIEVSHGGSQLNYKMQKIKILSGPEPLPRLSQYKTPRLCCFKDAKTTVNY
jgi:hypothetical protein